jgi:hypothetical protein
MLSGKHDRLKQTPYSVLVELVGDLVRRLLALPAEELAVWSTNLNEALAPNGQVWRVRRENSMRKGRGEVSLTLFLRGGFFF